jgi:hypothetical protein
MDNTNTHRRQKAWDHYQSMIADSVDAFKTAMATPDRTNALKLKRAQLKLNKASRKWRAINS